MGANDWQGCPVCEKQAKEYKDYAYGKVPKEIYDEIESKCNYILREESDSWSPDDYVDEFEYNGDDKKLDEILNWLQCSLDTSTPVRIDYCYCLKDDGTFHFDFGASCHNCGTDFEEWKNG